MGGARGFIYAFILLRIGQLPDLSPEINAVYLKLGPVIRRPRFISPTVRGALMLHVPRQCEDARNRCELGCPSPSRAHYRWKWWTGWHRRHCSRRWADCSAGRSLTGDAKKIIDADGLAVTPGFIDIKTHSDFVLPINPKAESKVRQGVTTEIVGH
jgi:hypothetical protein